MALTKTDIRKEVGRHLHFSESETIAVVDTLVEILKNRLASGEDVLVTGFGRFCIKEKPGRQWWNPASDKEMMLPAKRVVTFRASGILRNRLNC